jgi:hypothetical protein
LASLPFSGFAQSVREIPPDQLVLIIMKNETAKELKKACAGRFPQYEIQNNAAYTSSPFSKVESEKAIALYAAKERWDGFLRGLGRLRQSTAADFQRMDDQALGVRCASFPQALVELGAP